MKNILIFVFIAVLNVCAFGKPKVVDGYPLANFALTVNASQNGDLYGHIMQNTGELGAWLSNRGQALFAIEKNNATHSFSEFRKKNVNRSFPFVKNSYEDSTLISSKIKIETFCPLGINDIDISSLPVLLMRMTCDNRTSKNETFNIVISPDSAFAKNMKLTKTFDYSGVANDKYQITCDAKTQWENGKLTIPVNMESGTSKTIQFVFAFYDETHISANRFADIRELTNYTHKTWSVLMDKTEQFSRAIPQTFDTNLNNYLRWYMIPGISLTKCTKNNEILTMGYCELNQRDSYWTSWLHLVLFKDAERKMIEESIEYQKPSGKIPTTILPLIERNDDLDINAFFILRAARFFQYYNDREALASHWDAMKKAMDWLISRDAGDGIPAQVSFWGDWKDVKGVENRKYSPFSGLIYLAALKQMINLGYECNDDESFKKYGEHYKKAYDFINKPVEEGGLWNGEYYCQIWKDKSVNDKLLQDQTIGILFGVVPNDRAEKIINSLNSKSLTEYGIAETFPYYPESYGYKPATYHNGAVWPWLSFMDCWARLRIGRVHEALELVNRVALADLVNSGDWSPNEHINSLTGENLGFKLQGWNAGLFGVIYFGLIHPGIIH